MTDCIHHIDLCPDCGGLQATTLERLEGVASVRIDGGPELPIMALYVGPSPESCESAEATEVPQ